MKWLFESGRDKKQKKGEKVMDIFIVLTKKCNGTAFFKENLLVLN